jgi:hypothetical protein
MKIEILHEAEEELNQAAAYYEEIEPGCRDRAFETEIRIVDGVLAVETGLN